MSYDLLIFPYDHTVIILTILFTIFSGWKGLIQSILGLMTWVGSIIITLYSYDSLSSYINYRLLDIELFQNYETLSSLLSYIISIPIIFLLSLFILKKIRKVLSSDLDKQIFGMIIDKVFGLIYGLVFSYFIFSSVIFFTNRFEFYSFNNWLTENSIILNNINNINNETFINLLNEDNI